MRDTLYRLLNICRKELLVILKDPANRLVLVLPTIVQSLIFGYAATFDLRAVPYALLDQDGGQAATELIARVDGTGFFERVATLHSADDPAHRAALRAAPAGRRAGAGAGDRRCA